MTSFFSTQTQVALIDTRNNPGTIQLPAATTFAFRSILLKDIYGTFAVNSLTLTTSGSDTFEDGTTSKILTTNAGYIQVYAGQAGKWYILSSTDVLQLKVSSLQFSTLVGPLPQLSTVALFTSNTSNYFLPTLSNNYSTNLSTISLFTSNTSNYFLPSLSNNYSTNLSTVSLFTSNTSNYYNNVLQNYSTAVSSVALFTSNTSNFFSNTFQNWSTPLSTVALFTSNTSNYYVNAIQNWSTPLISTTIGLGNIYLSTSGGGGGGLATIPNNLSTMAIFTSSLLASTIQTITLSSQALYVSSFYTATRQLTPMFITF